MIRSEIQNALALFPLSPVNTCKMNVTNLRINHFKGAVFIKLTLKATEDWLAVTQASPGSP